MGAGQLRRLVIALAAMMALCPLVRAQPEAGWTTLMPAAGARVIHVSSSTGSDDNTGSKSTSAVKTLARGYELMRDGHPDWLLLRCGDVWKESFAGWDKSASSTTMYMVIGSYGEGPRPVVASGEDSGFSALSTEPRRGLAIVGIEFRASGRGESESAGIEFVQNWGHVLIEDCYVSLYRDNIAFVPLTPENRATDIRIRRCIVVDSFHRGAAHSQGIFLGNCDNWLIEECLLDRNAANKGTIFCHNVYVHEASGPGTFRGNISARANSHGVQQRPGGVCENNLLLRNPIGVLIGRSQTSPTESNRVRYNVVLDGKDISPAERRAQGLEISDVERARVELNIIAHQQTGTENITAIGFTRSLNVTLRDNVVYKWSRPGVETGMALFWGGACAGMCEISGNRFSQPQGGMLVAHGFDSPYLPGFRYAANKYYSVNPLKVYLWFANDSSFLSNAEWVGLVGEQGSTFGAVPMPDPERRIEGYCKTIGIDGSLESFLAEARRQSRQFWRPALTAQKANRWFREGFGVYCPADFDRDGAFAAADFTAFQTAVTAGDLRADMNRDGQLNILDFVAFIAAANEGCPY